MSDYGDMVIANLDGVPTVQRADETIGIAADLLATDTDTRYLWTDPTGALVFAGQVAYVPVRFDQDGRVIVCRRVWSNLGGQQ